MPASYAFEVDGGVRLVQLFSTLSNFGPLGKKCEARRRRLPQTSRPASGPDDRRRGWSPFPPVTDLVRGKVLDGRKTM